MLLGTVFGKGGLGRFARDIRGVSAVEYVIMAAFIGLALIGGISSIGTPLNSWYSQLALAAGRLPASR